MPMNRIYTGREAAQFLIDKLDLDEYFDPRIQSMQLDKQLDKGE
jgi:hypothetical protein